MSSFGEPFEYSIGVEPSLMQQEDPLLNLSMVKNRMDTLHHLLSQSLNTSTLISKHQMDHVSSEIAAAIHQIIVNGAALLSSARKTHYSNPKPDKAEYCKVIELDPVELLLSEHLHYFCDICGKGFKRGANLRMHMRAHGDQSKTLEALKSGQKTMFSCPYGGCNRNKKHDNFRALKSVICVRNHFKRSHCPKMYGCNRCHKKMFSILGDLRIHLKHCVVGEGSKNKCKCNCGNIFCRKDELFRHLSLFEGHMPAVETEEEGDRKLNGAAEDGGKGRGVDEGVEGCLENGLFDGLLDGFGSFENYCLQDLLGSS